MKLLVKKYESKLWGVLSTISYVMLNDQEAFSYLSSEISRGKIMERRSRGKAIGRVLCWEIMCVREYLTRKRIYTRAERCYGT